MRPFAYSFATVTLVLSALPASAATLIGANVSEQYYYPDLATPYIPTTYTPQSFMIGAGQESTIVLEGVTTFGVDFSDMSLDLDFETNLSSPTFGSSAFNGLVFTSSAFTQFSGVTVDGTTNLAGLDASRVSLVGDELRIDWNGLSYNSDTLVSLDFNSSVPEPMTWALLLLGFGIVGTTLRLPGARAIRPF